MKIVLSAFMAVFKDKKFSEDAANRALYVGDNTHFEDLYTHMAAVSDIQKKVFREIKLNMKIDKSFDEIVGAFLHVVVCMNLCIKF